MQIAPQPRPHPLNRDFQWQDVPAQRTLGMLSREQVRAFDRDGFLRIETVFTPQEIDAVVRAIDPIEAAYETYVSEEQGGNFRLTSAGTITFTAHIVKQSRILRDFAAHPAIRAILHDLIGGSVRLYWDQSVYKKTGRKQEFPWHQDNGYTFIEPQQYLTLWIPLADVDEENGCPWIVPGLHRGGTIEHWMTPIGLKCLEDTQGVAVPGRAGDIILFSSLAPHRTGPNLRDGTVRKAYILQYAPDGAYTIVNGEEIVQNDPERQFMVVPED